MWVSKKMKRCLITGAAGFIGRHLTARVIEAGYDVIGIDNMLGGYEDNVPKNIEFHIVASGISGDPRLNSFCGYRPPEQTGKNVFAYQWMTQKHLDGAFKDLDIDSQIQKIEGVSAVRLPEVYKGNTLTHNWSISWLVDYLNENKNASENS